ncbi:unnamed protein product, partial [Didymodactylos carnosus]
MYRTSSDRKNILINQKKKMQNQNSSPSSSADLDSKLTSIITNILNNPIFIKSIVDQVKEHLTQIQETVAKHTDEITELQLKSNDMEQYDRRLNILVHGIPEKDGEITNDLFIDMCDSIQVNIKQTDIS